MPKKYMQVLLSINFCLTAMTAIANSDPESDSTESFEIIYDESLNEYIEQFNQIWDCLDKMNTSRPSKLLQSLIGQYKENIAKPFQYDEGLEEVSEDDLKDQGTQLKSSLEQIRLNYQDEERLDQKILNAQFDKIVGYLDAICSRYNSTINMPKKEKAFLKQHLGQLQVFSQNFISPLAFALSNQFYHIWNHLDKVNTLHPFELLQSLLAQHKEAMKNPIPSNEMLQEISKEELDDQFRQLDEFLKICENYQIEEEIDEDTKGNLDSQFNAIKDCAKIIHEIHEKESLLKAEKVLLKHQLAELQHFSQKLIDDKKNHVNPEASLVIVEWKDQFNQIWDCLDKMNTPHPSKLLEFFILRHKEDMEKPFLYDKNLEEISKEDLGNQFNQLEKLFAIYLNNQLKEATEEEIEKLSVQFNDLNNYLKTIYEIYNSKAEPLSKEEKSFLSYQLGKLQGFLQNFISPVVIELSNQFHYIWNRLDKINNIHPSNLLQSLISQHKEDMVKLIPYDKNLEGISKEELDNQFEQLFKLFKFCSKYQFKEELDEASKEKLRLQFNAIENFLGLIQDIYISKTEPLSKEDQVFLKYRLQELLNFSKNLINFEIKLSPLSKMQELLEACQEEDLSIYAQYEPVLNYEEVQSLEFLTDSETKKIFIYFNESEGLIEIQHQSAKEKPYSTTWKIGNADMSFMKGWKRYDQITLTKTGLLSKYSMSKYLLGESLEYTINNNRKTSVRANFVCKSSRENTYTILSIDYHENVVILKNGPCLFIQEDLNNWHVKDIVVLQKTGSALDTEKSHKLINKTRSSTVSCSLRKKSKGEKPIN